VSIAAATSADDGLRLTTKDGGSVTWWRSTDAPSRWDGPGLLASAADWRRADSGIEWTEFSISGGGEASALRLIALRLEPRRLRFALQSRMTESGGRPGWTLKEAPDDAIVAMNAGMFVDALPWGWVVSRGGELFPPGYGPLSSAVVVTSDGNLQLLDQMQLTAWRGRRDIVEAFQTYPTLLRGDGEVPRELREDGSVDRSHRDARLAIGVDREGRTLIVLTRLDVGIAALERVPLGLTVPEMAAVTGSLGASRAALLDGGLSAQLRLREASGVVREWKGTRAVPLALLVRKR